MVAALNEVTLAPVVRFRQISRPTLLPLSFLKVPAAITLLGTGPGVRA